MAALMPVSSTTFSGMARPGLTSWENSATLVVLEAHRANFDDFILIGIEARGFKVQHHKGRLLQKAVVAAGDDLRGVLNEIALAAGDKLDVLAAPRQTPPGRPVPRHGR